jgi:hypothetical protein
MKWKISSRTRSHAHPALLDEALWVDQLPVPILNYLPILHDLSFPVDLVAPELPIVAKPAPELHLASPLLDPVLKLAFVRDPL